MGLWQTFGSTPIQARGLFTLNNDTIAVRGYDKFFNVEENHSQKKLI